MTGFKGRKDKSLPGFETGHFVNVRFHVKTICLKLLILLKALCDQPFTFGYSSFFNDFSSTVPRKGVIIIITTLPCVDVTPSYVLELYAQSVIYMLLKTATRKLLTFGARLSAY